ncbi:hypothetical protein PIROE2DRAFT_10502 [Piromyces sp. E2]|nr:hypothetical protein PIROE2DRAFT_10502 [Piromyces sp. E2]|eukprot:OUM63034.1 hypothetical protein PIROE2DRAFT_10502 [Piromyces sp. E2]
MKKKGLHLFLIILLTLLKFGFGENEAKVDIICNGININLKLNEFFVYDNPYIDKDCTIKIGQGYVALPMESVDKTNEYSYHISNISGKYEIIGLGTFKSFFECPLNYEKDQITILNIENIKGSLTIKDIAFRNCFEKNQYLSAVNISSSNNVVFKNCEFNNMKILVVNINKFSDVIFENVYIHHISYDDPNGSYKFTDLFKGIINIETESSLSVKNSKLYGCDGECKNYSIYVEDGLFLTIQNSEFKNAAGGIYISSVETCTIKNSIFKDHDMTLNKISKYDMPGALYGGGIYVNTTLNMNIYDSQFINNVAIGEGGAIFINDFVEESSFIFKNITFNTNFSYGPGKDISVAGEDITMELNNIFITGGGDSRWNNDTTPSIMIYNKSHMTIKDIIIKDYSINSTLIKIDDPCDGSNVSIDKISVSDATIDTLIESEIVQLNVKDLTVENTSSAHGSPLIHIKRGSINFDNLKVYNYNGCADNDNGCINDQNEIIYDRKAVMFNVEEACNLNLYNSYIGYVEMNSLLNHGVNSNIYINNTDIKSSRFINGVIRCTDAKPYRIGNILITNSRINSIYNEYGTIIQVLTVDEPPSNKILFDNVSMENCGAKKFGGILLSFSNYTSDIVSFENCSFKDISAVKGDFYI